MEKYLDAIAAANPDDLWKNEYGNRSATGCRLKAKLTSVLIATAYWA